MAEPRRDLFGYKRLERVIEGEVPIAPLIDWTKRNGSFLWFTRMQVAALSAKCEVIEGLAALIQQFGIVLIDRGQNEFSGEAWHRVRIDLQQYLLLSTVELKHAFVEEFSKLDGVRLQLAHDAQAFAIWISQVQANFQRTNPVIGLAFRDGSKLGFASFAREMVTQ
jgi:hypothetical protein